ncbi:MAG: SpoIID/LytB domain-containing protein [Clostridia bacterium]|nr:SpoIID/LytB domain-containing protein [Clostridia bacterium]
MKKKVSVILALIMSFMLLTVNADSYNEYSEVKVGLYFGGSAKSTVTLGSPGGFNIHFGEAQGLGYNFSMLEDEIVISKCDEKDFYINGNYFIAPGEFAVIPARGIITVDGKEYRGFILFKRLSGSDMTVINVLGLEEYLYSVVGKEMYPSWPLEALKAQAVCARTYAKLNAGKHSAYGFDLCSNQDCQVYLGVSQEDKKTITAVRETTGETVRVDGVPAEVFYFSSDGGSTEDSENVWGRAFSHLKGVKDPYENPDEATKYTWSNTISKSDLTKKLSLKGVKIGDIESIDITKTSRMGRVTELVINGTEGAYTASLEKTRTLLGGDLVYSQHFTVTDDDDTLTFDGRGWGHAVGMSQWGAKAMADKGFDYQDILKFYFTGVEVY